MYGHNGVITMIKVRSYETFCGIMQIVTCDMYRVMYNKQYYEAEKRLRIMQILQPTEFEAYLSRWKSERKRSYENIQ